MFPLSPLAIGVLAVVGVGAGIARNASSRGGTKTNVAGMTTLPNIIRSGIGRVFDLPSHTVVPAAEPTSGQGDLSDAIRAANEALRGAGSNHNSFISRFVDAPGSFVRNLVRSVSPDEMGPTLSTVIAAGYVPPPPPPPKPKPKATVTQSLIDSVFGENAPTVTQINNTFGTGIRPDELRYLVTAGGNGEGEAGSGSAGDSGGSGEGSAGDSGAGDGGGGGSGAAAP